MRPLPLPAAIAALALFATGAAAAQTPTTQAQASPNAHAGQGAAAMDMKGMNTPEMAGMAMSGGMGGMTMSGMTPPAPMPPPPGPILALDAQQATPPPAPTVSPGRITLTFGRSTTVRELTLTNAVGQQVPTHATLPETPVQSLTFPVPIPLAPGAYRLAWDAADDGPLGRGSLAFAVLQADGRAAPAAPAGHHHN